MATKLVLLGTGTPNACPNASGPASAEMAWRCEAILQEIRDAGYDGKVVNGQDLDIFE